MKKLIRNSTFILSLSITVALFSVPTIQLASAAMYHGPAGPSPITSLPKNPNVPFQYGRGMKIFRDKCSVCHGQWAEGTADKGPPLVHPYYEPSHHDDNSFFRAALSGVTAHHWHFGNMPRIEGISEQDVGLVVQFIRWWQRENGIR